MDIEFLGSFLLFGILAFIMHAYAYKKGFFSLENREFLHPLNGGQFFCFGVIYLISLFLLPSFTYIILKQSMPSLTSWRDSRVLFLLQMLSTLEGLVLIAIYSATQSRKTMKEIWYAKKGFFFFAIPKEILYAAGVWILSFPAILALYQLGEMINMKIFHEVTPEQIAVKYLKEALQDSSFSAVAIISVVFLVPILEEFIFRGCIFTYFRTRLGFLGALLTSSLLFSLFHFVPSQGIGNFPLLTSLFFLALYLGFIYEKRQTLLSPIAFHIIFNASSVIRLMFVS